jgi:hypothetical protein
MNISTVKAWLAERPRWTAGSAIVAVLVLYMLGIEWPLVVTLLLALMLFLPMPKAFGSVFGRLLVALFFLYALLQLAALVQLYTYPQGKFAYIAVLISLATLGLLALFGEAPRTRLPIVNIKDVGVITG